MRIEKVLTQLELTIDLSIPVLRAIAGSVGLSRATVHHTLPKPVQCEIDNFVNALPNLIERGVDKVSEPMNNDDLI